MKHLSENTAENLPPKNLKINKTKKKKKTKQNPNKPKKKKKPEKSPKHQGNDIFY